MTGHRGSHARFGRALGVAVVVAVLAVVGTSCEPAPPPGTSHSPSGYVDGVTLTAIGVTSGSYTVRVQGWASDWDTTTPIKVVFLAVHKDGTSRWYSGTFDANKPRPDVAAAYGRGANYGFDETLSFAWESVTNICVSTLNVGPGDNTFLGCESTGLPIVDLWTKKPHLQGRPNI